MTRRKFCIAAALVAVVVSVGATDAVAQRGMSEDEIIAYCAMRRGGESRKALICQMKMRVKAGERAARDARQLEAPARLRLPGKKGKWR